MFTVIFMKEQGERFYKHIIKATSLKSFLDNSLHPSAKNLSARSPPNSPPHCFVLFFLFPPPSQLTIPALGPLTLKMLL